MNKLLNRRVIGLSIAIMCIVIVSLVVIMNKKEVTADKKSTAIEFTVCTSAVDKCKIALTNKGVFDTEYFKEDSRVYNNDLAKTSLLFSLGASSTAESIDNWGKTDVRVAHVRDRRINKTESRNGNIVEVYKQLGFFDDVYYKYAVSLNDTSDTAAYAIARRKIRVNGKIFDLVNVSVRSNLYGAEWASNFCVKNKGGLTGFASAGKEVSKNLIKYIRKNHLGNSTKVWITGFSRGAGVANTAAAYFDQACAKGKVDIDTKNVYAYSFATPQAVVDNEENDIHGSLYDNIFCVINKADIVTKTAPKCWGYGRYGKVYELPIIHIEGKDLKNIEKGKKVDVDPEIVELVKNISYTYNEFRYANSTESFKYKPYKLYKGFAVNEEFADILDIAFNIIASSADEYKDKWQDAVTDLVPFVIKQCKKYDQQKKIWVNYDSLTEYIIEKYDRDVLEDAIKVGVFSEKDYNSTMKIVNKLYLSIDDLEDEENRTKNQLSAIVDTYYGLRILAIYYGISGYDVKQITNRAFERIIDIVKRALPISDSLEFKSNHFGEFYYSWLTHYDVVNQKPFKN